MTATEIASRDLRRLTDDQLADIYISGGDAGRLAISREYRRRDQRARQSAADKQWWRNVEAEWYDGAYAQYLAAEAATNGYLLNRAGRDAGIDPWSLWTGPSSRAAKYASEELRNWWEAPHNRRVTKSEYAYHAARPGRYQRES